MTGKELMKLLIADESIELIHYYARSKPALTSPKIIEHPIKLDEKQRSEEVDAVYCCLGTTIKKAGSQEAFEKVDREMVVDFARHHKNAGSFNVISAMGADPNSSIFYNKVKGQMENDLKDLGLKSCYVLRPSILLGDRNEFRLGERIGVVMMQILSPLMIASLKKYRPIKAKTVASTLLKCSKEHEPGFHVLDSQEIKEKVRN